MHQSADYSSKYQSGDEMSDYIGEDYAKAIGPPPQLPASQIYLRPTNAYL